MSGIPSPSPARINGGDRDKDSMWYFSSEDLSNSPSRKAGISPDQELSYRQMTAYLIQEMGQRLQVSQLCINTAIVYMHRFYAFHSFTHFHRNGIAAASLFLAAKVEEQPRKLEHVIKTVNKCLNQCQNQPTTSTTESYYLEQAQDLVFNENVLLQTLGFDVAIDHPHTHVVKTCQLVKASKDLAQTSYFLASNSLHLTSMCLQYKPSVVACFCIHLACKWSHWEIQQSIEGKHWFHYVDETVTIDLLKKLTDEFIAIYEKSPTRLKSKLNSIKAIAQRQGQTKDKKSDQDWKVSDMLNMKMYHPAEKVNSSSQSQSSLSQYSNQAPAVGDSLSQQVGSISQPMLPPPTHQSQQMRKPDLHSSNQHRTHHSSSSSTSHHPPKISFTTGDVPDHKLNAGHSKQQQQSQPYICNNMVSNRPPREHNSSMLAHSSNKSSSTSSRTSMSNTLPGPPPRQSSSQGHPIEVNYHKSRERSVTVTPSSSGHSIPAHSIPHKLLQKQDGSRAVSSKDHPSRLTADQNKQNNSNNGSNKMFPPASSQYGGSNLQIPSGSNNNGSQLSSKLDTMHDVTRNLMHTSRTGYNNPPPPSQPLSNGPNAPLLNFHQQQQGLRHSSNNSTSNNNNNSSINLKHEQSKQISVHMQQQSQNATLHHKQQTLSTDQSYSGITVGHDLHQQSHAVSSLVNNNYNKVEPLQHSEEPSHSSNQYNQQAPTHAAKAGNSLFSPEWNEKIQGQQTDNSLSQQIQSTLTGSGMNNFGNNSGNLAQNSELYPASAYKIPSSSISNKESSPSKNKAERDIPSKKDRSRQNLTNQDNGRSASGHIAAQQQLLKTSNLKKSDSSLTSSLTGINEIVCANNMGTVGGMKRPNELVIIKQEEDLLIRENKIRKLDTSACNDVGKLQIVNGIETNPDLVRNLLKESLCSTSGLLKTESSIITPSLQPPAELFDPSAITSIPKQHNTSITPISNNVLPGNSDVSVMETDEHGISGSKSEKKKKKDKHKHKEKDKSKDREERKKHKKDKDRHKDKERDRDNSDNGNPNVSGSAEHVKIKISKEKLESSCEPIGFKIKIPKDRITSDINTGSSSQTNTNSIALHAPPVLKIKISKDKLESYSSGSTELVTGMAAITHPSYAHGQSIAASLHGAAGSHHNPPTTMHTTSSKKKDREKDRERDKDKKRSHDSMSSKSCGNTGGVHSLNSSGILSSNATSGSSTGQNHSSANSSGSSSTQKYSSKMHHQNSMSLLFGESNESNDDDDDYNDGY